MNKPEEDGSQRAPRKWRPILRRERNVLIGFAVVTLILWLIHPPLGVIGIGLYGMHLIYMVLYYTRLP